MPRKSLSPFIAISALVVLLAGCGKTEAPPQTVTQPTAAPQEVVSAPPPVPPKPTHFYSLAEDGEYGYEQGISEDDRKAGKVTSPLLMVRYYREKDGAHSIAMVKGAARNTYTCKAPCDFVKSKVTYNGQVVQSETMRTTEGSMIWAMMSDAINGELKPYKAGKP